MTGGGRSEERSGIAQGVGTVGETGGEGQIEERRRGRGGEMVVDGR